jgi:DNA repair protein RadC
MRLRELHVTYRPVAGAPAGPRPRLTLPAQSARLIAPLLDCEAVEIFGLLLLNTNHEPIAWHVLSRGILDATLIHPREAIKVACLANAAAVIVAHNHPSGDPEPSTEDLEAAARLRQAFELVGIGLLDFLVIGEAGRYCSLRQSGRF